VQRHTQPASCVLLKKAPKIQLSILSIDPCGLMLATCHSHFANTNPKKRKTGGSKNSRHSKRGEAIK